MGNLEALEIKAFVPAKDFDLSRRFYTDLGFTEAWASEDMAYFHAGNSSFLLQKFYVKEHADNFMMHLLVKDVDAWWQLVESRQLGKKYGVRVNPPEDRPWGMRDFTIDDPTGVLWHIGQNIEKSIGKDVETTGPV
jgi:uncharacterized glyoxalase superfamily protein PhnB